MKDKDITIIIDSGAVSNIISKACLNKIDWKIQKPSNINLIGINGNKERPLGEVIDLPITLGNQKLNINALVTEKGDYDLLLGNIWAHEHQAIVDWKRKILTFEINNQKREIPVSCLKRRDEEQNEEILFTQKDDIEIKVYLDKEKGKEPEKAHNTDAGFDLRYPEDKPLEIKPGKITFIDSYIAIEIPENTYCQLVSRSSLAKQGIEIKGGIIDAGYTGNIGIILYNNSDQTYIIQPNEKIAQAVFLPLIKISNLKIINTREELGNSKRGQQGFGSSGRFNLIDFDLSDEFEYEIEEEEIADQPLLQIKKERDDQTILNIQVKENYTQLNDQQFFHSTFEEMKTNEIIGFEKCPHENNKILGDCLTCNQEQDLFQ